MSRRLAGCLVLLNNIQSVHGFDRTLHLVATRREEDDTEMETPVECVTTSSLRLLHLTDVVQVANIVPAQPHLDVPSLPIPTDCADIPCNTPTGMATPYTSASRFMGYYAPHGFSLSRLPFTNSCISQQYVSNAIATLKLVLEQTLKHRGYPA